MEAGTITRWHPALTLPAYDDLPAELGLPRCDAGTAYYDALEDYSAMEEPFEAAQGRGFGLMRMLGWGWVPLRHPPDWTMLLEIQHVPWSGSITFALPSADLAAGRWDRVQATADFGDD